jgi:hypothetical protein
MDPEPRPLADARVCCASDEKAGSREWTVILRGLPPTTYTRGARQPVCPPGRLTMASPRPASRLTFLWRPSTESMGD